MEFRDIKNKIGIPLFKYYGNIEYAKDAIKNRRIHLEKPAEYNDIYDSSFSIQEEHLQRMHLGKFSQTNPFKKYFEFLNEDELEGLCKKNLSIGQLIDYACDINKEIDKDKFKKDTISYVTNGISVLQADNNKISCFSEINNSLLMWAYYAKNYSGVCIRFDAPKDEILSQHCRKMQYTNHYIIENSFDNYFRKSIQWSHEQEWRIVCDTSEEYLSVETIDAIYLGIRMDESTEAAFIELGRIHNLEVYKMKISNTKYEILFDRIV